MGNRYLWEIHLTFSRDKASYEEVLVDAPGGLIGLRDTLMASDNEQELYIIARAGDKLELIPRVWSHISPPTLQSTHSKWYPRTCCFQVQVGQTIATADQPNYSPRPSYSFFPFGTHQIDDCLTRMAFGVVQEDHYNQRALGCRKPPSSVGLLNLLIVKCAMSSEYFLTRSDKSR
jgi:hypothetical protein